MTMEIQGPFENHPRAIPRETKTKKQYYNFVILLEAIDNLIESHGP